VTRYWRWLACYNRSRMALAANSAGCRHKRRGRRSLIKEALSLLVIASSWTALCGSPSAQEVEVHDPRLKLTLFAEDPDIVTPIGMVIDNRDRVFVIESHTHLPARDYDGPDGDRIKLFADNDGDGVAESVHIFAEGIQQAMNLAFSPAGDLYVVCAREVLCLPDRNSDDRADRVQRVLWLDTTERYAHNSLLGIAFDGDGKLYVSRGNTGARLHALRGSDDSYVEGYGDGGSVIRANADGSEVEPFATGFWNPFDLKFIASGELMLVDNDPDARGPNRLLKVVEGGDYGYKSLYGGGGNHPFQGWDGTLPGTLPYIAGTGEAPSGLIDLKRSSFPVEYGNSLLATIWNENSIERFELLRSASGITARKSIFMTGPKDFRPVALDCDSKGNLFVTDWVLVDYPNHGRGRIWRLANQAEGAESIQPLGYFGRDATLEEQSGAPEAELASAELDAGDPYERHRVIRALAQPQNAALLMAARQSDDAQRRLAALFALELQGELPRPTLVEFLKDADEEVRLAALVTAAESFRPELRDAIDLALEGDNVTPRLFEAWLAATQNLNPDFVRRLRARAEDKSSDLRVDLDPQVLYGTMRRQELDDGVRAMAVRRLDDGLAEKVRGELLALAASANEALAVASLERLSRLSDHRDASEIAALCRSIAEDDQRSTGWRCAALESWARLGVGGAEFLVDLLGATDQQVAIAAADALRLRAAGQLDPLLLDKALARDDLPERARESLNYARFGTDPSRNSYMHRRPQDKKAWTAWLAESGDAFRGRRIFQSPAVGCAKCHTIDGLGALLGPDLSRVAQSKSRLQIIESVLEPSAEFPPQYQAWLVVTDDGQIHRGLQLDHKAGGAIVLTSEDGESLRFEAEEIADYQASPNSLMPNGLEETMSAWELRDLIEFLCTLK
jgi:putative membrane-bound dehydrogenase-like protein